MGKRYSYVFHNGRTLTRIGRNKDGTLWNPDGHPEDLVREVVEGLERKAAERRSKSAREAAVTRQRRQHNRIWSAAKAILSGQGIGEREL
jgi:hypothetical protein